MGPGLPSPTARPSTSVIGVTSIAVPVKNASAGTSELHVTNEYFLPIFRNRDYRTYLAHWNTLYGITYLGAGNVGYSFSDPVRLHNYVVDAGLGTEASITIRDFEVLLSAVYAHTVRAPTGLSGGKYHLSIRTIR